MEEVGPGLGGRVELLSTLTTFTSSGLSFVPLQTWSKVLAVSGVLTMALALLGCVGALKELRCLLGLVSGIPHPHCRPAPGRPEHLSALSTLSTVFWNAAAPVRHTDNLGDPHLHSAGPGEFAIITQGLEVEGLGQRERGRWALPSARKLGHRTARRERHMDKEVQGGMRRLEGKAGAVLLVLLILTGGGGESY